MENRPLASLQTELDRANAQMEQNLPAEMVKMFEQSIQQVKASARAAGLEAGAQAPDFSLTDQNGASMTLSELTANGPVVLLFYRGVWCPFCNIALRAYQQASRLFAEAGAQLVAISPQTPTYSASMKANNELGFPLLSDPRNEVAARYHLVFELPEALQGSYQSLGISLDEYHGDSSWKLPVPATYVIDRENIIRLAHVEADYKQRLEPSHVLDLLTSQNDW
ncbi:alkyl hydroperoxide reductase [Brevibacillus parabrevis]|uniref:peroxiredoxin-like family protein n=1 Tax=Brevibacillus parabrevis TaxID=54914 RepID=UPI0007AB8280|nr:peroxiredoxin-like family protein [Brevibacillus parabrevis]KZE47125.1 alkyl hydroperoxide reductase [Brevibacillus parabrevis]